jgi:hypothetical protein
MAHSRASPSAAVCGAHAFAGQAEPVSLPEGAVVLRVRTRANTMRLRSEGA